MFFGGVLAICSITMFAFVAFTWGQIPVQRYVALAHAQAMCLHFVCIVLKALLA